MASVVKIVTEFFVRRFFLVTWISFDLYLFYDTFIFYKNGRQFYHLRQMLGLGLCVSRGTATVLNLCCALVLLPLCKKLNQVVYCGLSKLWPGLFFYWLENAKSFHMTVAVTLLLFAVIHSLSHFANLWNFSRGYDDVRRDINFASYKNQSPFSLLISQAGLTGVCMLLILVCMAMTSLRPVRRKRYNAFWYTHQLYIPFMMLLIAHPLSGALKEEILENESSPYPSHIENFRNSSANNSPKFVAIKSKSLMWMALPLSCFFLDMLWRVFTRNHNRVNILEVTHMAGRTISLTMSCPQEFTQCRMGQYVLLQCIDISLLEWHPFTVVKMPTASERQLVVWIRVTGDWTESLEKIILEREPNRFSMLVDGPYSSPLEGASRSEIAICVAAGVGITPFVTILRHFLSNPRSRLPGRVHLLWVVRYEREITWLADLANKCMLVLRNANRPDRLQLELYITSKGNNPKDCKNGALTHVVVNDNGDIKHLLTNQREKNGEREALLTPINKRYGDDNVDIIKENNTYEIAKEYPLLGCRIRKGRPHWDRVFGYWVHLYPKQHLDLYCCGPKKLVKLLRSKCRHASRITKTKFTFVHEGFA